MENPIFEGGEAGGESVDTLRYGAGQSQSFFA